MMDVARPTNHFADPGNKPATVMTDKDKQMRTGKMRESMSRMHEQMHKIIQASDAKEREKLIQEHSKMVQDHMHMIQGMMGGDAKCGNMAGGMKGQ